MRKVGVRFTAVAITFLFWASLLLNCVALYSGSTQRFTIFLPLLSYLTMNWLLRRVLEINVGLYQLFSSVSITTR